MIATMIATDVQRMPAQQVQKQAQHAPAPQASVQPTSVQPTSVQPAPVRDRQVPLTEMSHSAWTYADSIMLGGATGIVTSGDGYLWLGAARGLVRFDGVRFTVMDSAASPLLRTERAGRFAPLMLDHNGAMWISRPDGALISYEAGRFTVRVAPDSGRPSRVMEDASGHLLVWKPGAPGIRQLTASGDLVAVQLPFGQSTVLSNVIRDGGDGLVVGTSPLGLWHRAGGQWTRLSVPDSGAHGGVLPLISARDGSLWVTRKDWSYRLVGTRWVRLSQPGSPDTPIGIQALAEDAHGAIWIAARDDGLMRWTQGTLESFPSARGLSGADGLAVHVNAAGVVWVATGAGLDRFRVGAFAALPDYSPLHRATTTRIVQDDAGFSWVRDENNRPLLRLDGAPTHDIVPLAVRAFPLPAPLQSGFQLLDASRSGGAWLAPYSGGLVKVSGSGFAFIGDRAGVPHDRIWRMLETRSGALWLATLFGGVGRVTDGQYVAMQLGEFAQPAISSFAEDARGHVWISLDNVPRVFEMLEGRVLHELGERVGLRDTVLRLVPEHGDTLWGVGTSSLVRIIGQRATTIALPAVGVIRGPIVSVRVQGVPALDAFIDGTRLWIVGEGGIAHFDLAELHRAANDSTQTVRATFVTPQDGVTAPVARSRTLDPVSRIRDGRYLIRTPVGFVTLDPTRLSAEPVRAHAIIEDVAANGQRVPMDSLSMGPHVERVEVRVSATTEVFPERLRLEHRLDGVETSWMPTSASRVVTYTQLAPGTYRFHLRAMGTGAASGTTQGSDETVMQFRIAPAWYQTTGFRALMLIIMIAGGPIAAYAATRSRSKVRERQLQARFDAALAERTRVARELHDTLLQGFSGIVLQLQATLLSLDRSPNDAAERLARTLTVADATLLDARHAIWNMRAPGLEHLDLAAALEHSARDAVADKPIALRTTVHGERRRLSPMLESATLRIGREAVMNAVRHGRPTAIEIELAYGDAVLELCVRDDGRGIDEHQLMRASRLGHFGVKGMQERAIDAGGTLDLRGVPGGGTTVSLRIPIVAQRAPSEITAD